MSDQIKQNKKNQISIIIIVFILFIINPLFGIIFIFLIIFLKKNNGSLYSNFSKIIQGINTAQNKFQKNNSIISFNNTKETLTQNKNINSENPLSLSGLLNSNSSNKKIRLEKRKKYLHIALNNTIEEAMEIISKLPISDRILIEVGTPLIKIYGVDAISQIKSMLRQDTYIVADNKCADLADREVEMMANSGANAATCLGVAPIETINSFIEECAKFNIDSIIDMMNVPSAITILKKLKKLPDVVMLHRGVDESEFSKEKQIPYYQIKQIKGNYGVLVAVAGGDTINEVQSAIFNDADIVVVWKNFYQLSSDTAQLAQSFLKEIK